MTTLPDAPQVMRVPVTDELVDYVIAHGTPPDDVQQWLIDETRERFAGQAGMQVAPEQGAFLELLVRLTGARRVVEVGTFTGYSALSMARALPPDGRVLCCDVSEEWTGLAREAWARAGVQDRIELRIAPAMQTLRSLPTGPHVDLSFIDADKTGYQAYFEELIGRTRPGGLILADNVLYAGKVLDPTATGNAAAIREFNRLLAADERVDVVLLPLADGLTIARKR